MSYPLSGVRVADFGQLIAVPAATQMLAELGAEVIKVEPPEGEAARHMAAYGEAILLGFNRGKRAIVLDLKSDAGRRTARELIRRSDVFCHNLRPGAMDRLGLGRREVREINPKIINVSVSGYSSDTPSAVRPGLDIAAQAESGLMSITGEAHTDPQRVGAPIIDQATAYLVVQAILAALLKRARTGEGEDVEVALLDTAIHLQSVNWLENEVSGKPMTRRGNGQPSVAPGADIVHMPDGAFVLTAYKEEHLRRLCRLIGRPELPDDPDFIDNPSRVANRARLLELIAEGLGGRSASECVQVLNDHGLVAALVRDYDAVREAPDIVSGGVSVAMKKSPLVARSGSPLVARLKSPLFASCRNRR